MLEQDLCNVDKDAKAFGCGKNTSGEYAISEADSQEMPLKGYFGLKSHKCTKCEF